MKTSYILATACLALPMLSPAADIPLPKPAIDGGKPLMQALALRKSARDFAARPLPPNVLAGLLWAANGINRPDGHRTAPTGLNVQDIDIYVILPDGIYKYAADGNALQTVRSGDFRKAAGKQPFVHEAPVNLVFVQNLDKAMKGDDATKARHGGIHTGAIMQNVYLFCASENLISVARDYVDRAELAPLLGLTSKERIILTQTVGYSAKQTAMQGLAAVPAPPAGMDAACRIAMKHANVPANGAAEVKCELERRQGKAYYEVEFKYQGLEYEYDIDAATGAILKSKKERD